MKKYLLKLLLFAACICCFGWVTILLMEKEYDVKRNSKLSSIDFFIWGDSDIFRGLDLDMLSDSLGYAIASSAYEGSGIYDFLVFADEVPDSSTCVVAFSDWCFMKEMQYDGNRSGVCLDALKCLVSVGWSPKCLASILKDNQFRPAINFSNNHEPYPNLDTMVVSGTIEHWLDFYDKDHSFVSKKFKAFELGVDLLAEKGCTLIFMTFPICTELEAAVSNTFNRRQMYDLRESYIKRFNAAQHTISLPCDSLIMYDWFHLNQRGSIMATNALMKEKVFDGQNHFVTLVLDSMGMSY